MNPQKRDPNKILGADGVWRDGAEEKHLNDAFAACFRDLPGQRAIDYLRNHVLPATGPSRLLPNGAVIPVTDAELWHREGQRFLLALIETRIQHGRNDLPKLASQPDTA